MLYATKEVPMTSLVNENHAPLGRIPRLAADRSTQVPHRMVLALVTALGSITLAGVILLITATLVLLSHPQASDAPTPRPSPGPMAPQVLP